MGRIEGTLALVSSMELLRRHHGPSKPIFASNDSTEKYRIMGGHENVRAHCAGGPTAPLKR
eukprot:4664416-Pyramimonas_sp.AAC.1